MKEFFEEYGSVIVAVIAVVGLVAVVYYLVGSGKGSVISKNVVKWLNGLSGKAEGKIDSIGFMALSMLF